MASLNQLVSEIAHAVGEPNNVPLRRNIRYAILHTRNELIRKSYENHSYIDKGLNQRFRVEIVDIPDGDLYNSGKLGISAIKRTLNKVPKPVRLTNNLPFQSIRTVGKNNTEIAFVKESTAAGFVNLKGHRSVGGMRASIYNAMPIEGVEKLVAVMKEFEEKHV